VLADLGAMGLVLAACSSSSSPQSSGTTSTSPGAAGGGGAMVSTAQSAHYGTVLVSSSGRTLYMLTADSASASSCGSSCAPIWPPLTTTGAPVAGSGVQASLLGTVTRSDGSKQVTYGGHPLYMFSGDSAAGQVNGEGITSFGGTWYALDASGQPVKAMVSSTTSTTHGGGGYY
jgi:predicted lipoprotein with Yx(FWY)xxD motif